VKIWKLLKQHFGPFEDWQNFHKSLKLGVIALFSCYLLTDLLLMETKLAPVQAWQQFNLSYLN